VKFYCSSFHLFDYVSFGTSSTYYLKFSFRYYVMIGFFVQSRLLRSILFTSFILPITHTDSFLSSTFCCQLLVVYFHFLGIRGSLFASYALKELNIFIKGYLAFVNHLWLISFFFLFAIILREFEHFQMFLNFDLNYFDFQLSLNWFLTKTSRIIHLHGMHTQCNCKLITLRISIFFRPLDWKWLIIFQSYDINSYFRSLMPYNNAQSN
jgi:hypothetical protein